MTDTTTPEPQTVTLSTEEYAAFKTAQAKQLDAFRESAYRWAKRAVDEGADANQVNGYLASLGVYRRVPGSGTAYRMRYQATVTVTNYLGDSAVDAKAAAADTIRTNERDGLHRYTGAPLARPVEGTVEWQKADGSWLPEAEFWERHNDPQHETAQVTNLDQLRVMAREYARKLHRQHRFCSDEVRRAFKELELGAVPTKVNHQVEVAVSGTTTMEVPGLADDTDAEKAEATATQLATVNRRNPSRTLTQLPSAVKVPDEPQTTVSGSQGVQVGDHNTQANQF